MNTYDQDVDRYTRSVYRRSVILRLVIRELLHGKPFVLIPCSVGMMLFRIEFSTYSSIYFLSGTVLF